MTIRAILPACLLLLMVAGCTSLGGRETLRSELAQGAGLRPLPAAGGGFTFAALGRVARPGAPAVVYLEGDGFAWATPARPSSDPTPRNPVGLRLAAQDSAPNVLWLARPCQYDGRAADPPCGPAVWTRDRFAPEVVAALDQALDQLKAGTGVTGLHLVGYSGGGGIAALLAARRSDVLSLRSLAGNLDHEALHRHHRVSQLPGLNPAAAAPALAGLPQIHYVGGDDNVVPRLVADSYARAAGPGACLTVTLLPEASHDDIWQGWARLAGVLPTC